MPNVRCWTILILNQKPIFNIDCHGLTYLTINQYPIEFIGKRETVLRNIEQFNMFRIQRIHVFNEKKKQIDVMKHTVSRNTLGNAKKRVNRKFQPFQLPPVGWASIENRGTQQSAPRNDDKWYLIDHDRLWIYRYASVRQFICLVIAPFFPQRFVFCLNRNFNCN